MLEHLTLDDYVTGLFSRTPNLNILTASPNGTRRALVIMSDSAAIIPICMPAEIWGQNVRAALRPLEYPGVNTYRTDLSQAGCVNSTSAHPLQRCWPDVYMLEEVAAWGMVANEAGNPVPTNHNFLLWNVTCPCRYTVTRECVAKLTPVGCVLVTMQALAAAGGSGPSLAAPGSTPPPAATPPPGVAAVAEAGDGGGGSNGVNEAAIIGGSIAGCVVLLGLMGLVAWAVVRRRRGAAPDKRGSTGSQEAPSTVDWPAGSARDDPSNRHGAATTAATSRTWGSEGSSLPLPLPAVATKGGPASPPQSPAALRGASAASPPPPRLPRLDEVVVTPQTPLQAMPANIKVALPDLPSHTHSLSNPSSGRGGSGAASGQQGQGQGQPSGGGTDSTSAGLIKAADHSGVANAPCLDGYFSASTGASPSIASSINCGGGGGGEEADPVVRLTGVILGKGGFGRVYQGTFRGSLVAVKQLLDTLADAPVGSPDQLRESFCQELEVLGRCDHPNIVKVLAASVMGTTRPVMVLELMETSLDKVLYGFPGVVLPLATVLHIGREVAQGLSYLHPTVLHRDLKPANVLMNVSHGGRPVVKISDFGLSRLRTTILITEQPEAGTPAYMAPECYEVERIGISYHVDCYSFGVLLWEMLAGAHPWAGLSAVQIAHKTVLLGQRLETPPMSAPGGHASRWPPRLQRLLAQCWEADPLRRPAAADIVKTLALVEQELSMDGGEAQAQAQAQAHAAQHGKKQEAAMIEFSMA
ncbi:hypothetical protein HYH03_007144 [Edaphochlamys debaryana]|uniref:Protein kinase domain-containing protein n=1 Tax=Edaphochlamys debaryana TaxID=47281 RepID=A0A835Y2B3_9CHLO|nr:hypothetical protein HYH03_007144 [Edaphochlamys debaryana]|eukprot:KAG2494625.1 hypothetical protein HYH03_007144 [Edaphochlamys debaryana]